VKRWLALVAALAAWPSAAGAEGWRGGGSLALDLRGWQLEPDAGDRTRAVTAGPRVRAVGGKHALGLAAGIDLQLGVTGDGHFAHQVAVLPLGAGLQLGRSARIGAAGGVGVSGITGGVQPVDLALPVEAFAEVSLGDHVRAAAWGRTAAVADDHQRELGLTLRWDRRRAEWSYVAGNGYHLGAFWGERAGAELVGVIVGYSLDAAGG